MMGVREVEGVRAQPHSAWTSLRLGRWIGRVAVYVILILVAALMAAPFLWILSTSFKDAVSVYAVPPQWLPSPAVFDNYITAWQQIPFGNFYLNSLMIAGLTTIGQLITCSLAA